MERLFDRKIRRRTFIKVIPHVVAAGEALLLAACAKPDVPLPTIKHITAGPDKSPYPLAEDGGTLIDGGLGFLQHPFVEAVRFSFDPDPPSFRTNKGNLIMETTFRQDNEHRLISLELDSRSEGPGLIYCMSRLVKAGSIRQTPVIRFAPLEEYFISLGFKLPGEDCLKTYQDMLTYYITRDRDGKLQGRFEGLGTYNPKAPNFKARDTEARYYFDLGCLK